MVIIATYKIISKIGVGSISRKGYDFINIPDTGQRVAINRTTGEITPAVVVEVPAGSIHYTPEQQAAYKARQEAATKQHLQRKTGKKYTFIRSDIPYDDLSPATTARLFVLGTYAAYNSTKLIKTERKPMKRADLPEILSISNATACRFWAEVSPKYITETIKGELETKRNLFWRGKLSQGATGHTQYQQIYIDAVRSLYKTTPASKHRYLGHMFGMLQFLNIEYNMLCYDPWETNLALIHGMSFDDFCNMIGYSQEQRSRLRAEYARIVFPVNGVQQRFCSFVSDGVDIGGASIYVNPNVLYKGNNAEKVEILGAFCRV